MKISVVITVYNLEEFVKEAIDSAIRQTRPPFEVIVVNDHSTDRSDEIIRDYGDNVRYLCLPQNVGGLRAALAGLELARGDLVAFLDGDDVWDITKLEKCERLFEDPEMIMVSHQHARVDRWGNPLYVEDDTHRNINTILQKHSSPELRSTEFKRSVLEKRGYWLGSAYVIRRGALDLPAFKTWVESLPSPQNVYLDLVIAPYLILTNPTKNLGFVNEALFKYRLHEANSCNDYSTVDRALRSVHRGYFTTLASYDLICRCRSLQLAREAVVAHERALLYYKYLESLYSGKPWKAARRALRLAAWGYFSFYECVKEAARFCIVCIGGPELFLKLKAKTRSENQV